MEDQQRTPDEEWRALAVHLLAAQEAERSRLAREMHDELAQPLAGLKIDLLWLAIRLPDSPALQQKIKAMLTLLDSMIQSARQMATELRPAMLDDLGLAAAMEWQAQEFQARTATRCRFTSTLPGPRVDRDVSTAMFRILQEILTNVGRHANASGVDITLRAEADRLILTVQDDGRGITEEQIARPTSLGLLVMRARAHLLGGEFRIEGRPGKGTTVTVALPHRRTS